MIEAILESNITTMWIRRTTRVIEELHPDPEDENDPDEQIEDYGENEDEGAFEDADEDDPDGGGDNGHNGEEPMES